MRKYIWKKIFLSILSIVFASVGFSACHGYRSSGEPSKPHTHNTPIKATAPTCTEDGENVYECWCGLYLYEPIRAIGHKYIDGVCENCNHSMMEELTYTLSEDGSYYILSGIGNYFAPTLSVPDTYKDLPVREIGKAAFQYSPDKIYLVKLGKNINRIAENAFWGSRIQYITLSEGLTSIGKHAFRSCAITHIELPQSLLSIEACAFADSNLKSIDIPDNVTKIETDTFALCDDLWSVNIGRGVTVINENAFHQCTSLEFIILGQSLTTIKNQAFYGCDSLTNVYFNGTIEDWNYISIGNLNANLTDAELYIAYK